MKFITLKNYRKKLTYSVKFENDGNVLIYVFDDVKNSVIRCLVINREWLLKKLIN